MSEDRDSNIGMVGVESIRIKGRRIEDLPLGQGNEAKEGLPAAYDTERLNKINEINGKYPKQRIDYLKSRIVECNENIVRINNTKTQQATMISDYTGHIAMCEHRDKEIAKLEYDAEFGLINGATREDRVKELKKQFPPYQVGPMRQQIVQCKEAIARCEDVVQQENKSITEFSEVMALCKQRDIELAQYGAVAQGSPGGS